MWKIKFLKGDQIDKEIEINEGTLTLGRSHDCDIVIDNSGVSKRHAKISLKNNMLTLEDLKSRNGTFINGLRIRQKNIQSGDKISFHNVIIEAIEHSSQSHHVPAVSGDHFPSTKNTGIHSTNTHPPANIEHRVQEYFENVAMPGVYSIAERLDFKYVLGIFILAFVLLVTTLSVIPMIQITQQTVKKESQRRALTIAKAQSRAFQKALRFGGETSFNTRFAESETGVKQALIIAAKDGSIIAPAIRRGSYANNPFFHRARKKDNSYVEQVDNKTIAASIAIKVFDNETGINEPKYFSVVLYDMAELEINNEHMLGLFIQILFIALIIGSILFLFLYKVIEHPISSLTTQLDKALKSGEEKVVTKYQFPPLEKLTFYINNILTRSTQPVSDYNQARSRDVINEATNLTNMLLQPSFTIDAEGRIISVNTAFYKLLNINNTELSGMDISAIQDTAFEQNINELIQKSSEATYEIAYSTIDFDNIKHEISVQAFLGQEGIEYYLIILDEKYQEEASYE